MSFPHQCDFFSWTWPVSLRENHPAPSQPAHLQPTQIISSHFHRFPDVLQASSSAPFFCSPFEIINTALLNGCQSQVGSTTWHRGSGSAPTCWLAAPGRPWLYPSLGSTAGVRNAESSHGLGATELSWMEAGCSPCPDSVKKVPL